MTIKDGDFIKISYTGKLDNGTVFDTTNEELAKVHNIYNENARYGGDIIIIGANQIIQGLEEDIKEHDTGYDGTVSIPPQKGFGERNSKLVKDLPIKKFQQTPKEGMEVQIDGKMGTVTKVMGRHARVDFNTPMAGKTVTYNYKLEDVIEDTKDKIMGLSTLYTGHEMELEIEGTVARINVPLEFNYSQSWLISKGQMALEIIKYTDITEVLLIEKYTENMLKGTVEKAESEEIEPETEEE